MSAFIYPSLPGLTLEQVRKYEWKTLISEADSGVMTTVSRRVYPVIHWEHTYEVLRRYTASDELQQIVGLYNSLKGQFDTFLFTDPEFNTITPGAQATQYGIFGIGDGSTLGPFQLVSTFQVSGGPGAPEIIQNFNGTPILYDNGSTISAANYSIGSTGIVTFGVGHAPVSGHTLTWSGSWYYRCRFEEDAIVWSKFMNQLWKAAVKFRSVKL